MIYFKLTDIHRKYLVVLLFHLSFPGGTKGQICWAIFSAFLLSASDSFCFVEFVESKDSDRLLLFQRVREVHSFQKGHRSQPRSSHHRDGSHTPDTRNRKQETVPAVGEGHVMDRWRPTWTLSCSGDQDWFGMNGVTKIVQILNVPISVGFFRSHFFCLSNLIYFLTDRKYLFHTVYNLQITTIIQKKTNFFTRVYFPLFAGSYETKGTLFFYRFPSKVFS